MRERGIPVVDADSELSIPPAPVSPTRPPRLGCVHVSLYYTRDVVSRLGRDIARNPQAGDARPQEGRRGFPIVPRSRDCRR
jgi:hypothetical protein